MASRTSSPASGSGHMPSTIPGSLDPAVLYWFKTVRETGGKVQFVPHLIDSNSGVGTQVVTGDLNGDGWDDIVVGNKKGTFVFMHEVKEVDKPNVGSGSADARATSRGRRSTAPPIKARAQPGDGIPATAADGRVLNLDFEKGDLSDWTATGDAFEGSRSKATRCMHDAATASAGTKASIGLAHSSAAGDGPQGTLTSVPFQVTHPYASFLVGGGAGGARARRDCSSRHR